MNFNALIAVLVIKNIISQEEGENLVEHLNDKPQSTVLRDAITSVGEIIGAPAAGNIMQQLGPVGPAQQAEEIAARSAQPTSPVAPPPTPLEPANTQGPNTVTGPDQSGNEASLETPETDHAAKSEMSETQAERDDKNPIPSTDDKPADNPQNVNDGAGHPAASDAHDNAVVSDKNAKSSSVKKSTDKANKK
jgi:hypothetical protein